MLNFADSKFDIALSLSSLMMRKVDSLQKFRSLRNKIFVRNISSFFLSQAFRTCGKGKLVFVSCWC